MQPLLSADEKTGEREADKGTVGEHFCLLTPVLALAHCLVVVVAYSL